MNGVNRLATSAYKPPHLGKSLLLGLSRCVGQSYPLVADQVDLQSYSLIDWSTVRCTVVVFLSLPR